MVAINRSRRGGPSGALRPLSPGEAAARAANAWFEGERLETYLTRWPELCWQAPDGEFIIGAPWRRRSDIVSVVELRGVVHRQALLNCFVQQARAGGAKVAVPSFDELERSASFYRLAGFDVIDEIVRFERLGLTPPADAAHRETRYLDPKANGDWAALEAIDHAAFPWLWWNSLAELRWYAGLRSAQVILSIEDGRPVGYAGYSIFGDDGHLDRLAVLPECTGRGHGASLVRESFERLHRLGARRVALTTQGANERAQRLYRWFGFRRTSLRYRIYGLWLADDAPHPLP